MKTSTQILEELNCSMKSYIVEYLDIDGVRHRISLSANNKEEAELHCKYIYSNVLKILSSKEGSLMQMIIN